MPPDPVCETSRRLIAAAKTQGRLIATDDVPGTRYTIRSGESEVRLVQKDRVYYKIKNSFAKSHRVDDQADGVRMLVTYRMMTAEI